jgi:hypothetical protein
MALALLSGKMQKQRYQSVMKSQGLGFGREIRKIIGTPAAVMAVDNPDSGIPGLAWREHRRARVVMTDNRAGMDFECVEFPKSAAASAA